MTDPYVEHDHDVVVEDRGSGAGTILGILVILALLAAIWWFALGPGAGSGANTNNSNGGTDININVPSQQAPSS